VDGEEWSVGDTGLERFVRKPTYVSMEKQMLPLRYGSGAYLDEDGVVRGGVKGLGNK
jgi:oxygen-dependent protoporphyrinogen oxidase